MSEKVFFKIIIPNYNSIAYIKQCLDSILNQTFQDFKIVIVDDLSTDFSDKFCQMYARKYPNKIIFIRTTEKQYAGGCRNIGMSYNEICSKYTYFIDSDDFLLNNNCLQTLYNNLQDDTDVLLFSWCLYENKRYVNVDFEDFSKIKKQAILGTYKWNALWSKVIKTSKVKPCLENCMFGEDVYSWLQTYDCSEKIKQIRDVIYAYRQNNTSVVHTKNSMHFTTRNIFYNALKKLFDKTTKTELKRSIAKIIFNKAFLDKNVYNLIPNIYDANETLDALINTNKSYIRFGDGEFNMLFGKRNVFEKQNKLFEYKFEEILKNKNDDILVGIPKCHFYTQHGLLQITKNWITNVTIPDIIHNNILKFLNTSTQYADSYATILASQIEGTYINLDEYFEKIALIFKDKDVMLLTGDIRILTWQNNIFRYAKSITTKIYDMPKNSIDNYNSILRDIYQIVNGKIIVISFGPTGKLLAYDLNTIFGVRTLDFGHMFKLYDIYMHDKLNTISRNYIWKD